MLLRPNSFSRSRAQNYGTRGRFSHPTPTNPRKGSHGGHPNAFSRRTAEQLYANDEINPLGYLETEKRQDKYKYKYKYKYKDKDKYKEEERVCITQGRLSTVPPPPPPERPGLLSGKILYRRPARAAEMTLSVVNSGPP